MALQSKRQAATQPLQKFPRSYLGAGRGREPLGGAGRPGAEPCGRGEEGRGGARRAALPGGPQQGLLTAGLRDAGCGGRLSWETGRLPQRPDLAGEVREEGAERVRWLPAALPCHSLATALHWALWHNYCRGSAGSGTLIGFPAAIPLTGSGRSSPASLLLPASHRPTAFPFWLFASSSSFLGVGGRSMV